MCLFYLPLRPGNLHPPATYAVIRPAASHRGISSAPSMLPRGLAHDGALTLCQGLGILLRQRLPPSVSPAAPSGWLVGRRHGWVNSGSGAASSPTFGRSNRVGPTLSGTSALAKDRSSDLVEPSSGRVTVFATESHDRVNHGQRLFSPNQDATRVVLWLDGLVDVRSGTGARMFVRADLPR